MKVLVTGATGFLGKALSFRLQKMGYEVTVLGRNLEICRQLEGSIFRVLKSDLTNNNQIINACENQNYVFHCGALSSPWGKYQDFYSANVIGTQNVVQGCMAHNINRLIHVSTPSIYFDFTDKCNISERDVLPLKSVNAYAKTKLLAENEIDLAYQQGLSVMTIRPRGLFGPGDTAILPRLIKAHASMSLPLFKKGKVLVDMTYVDNVVEALILCMNAPNEAIGKKFNITNDEPMYIIELLEKLFMRLGIKLKTKFVNYQIANLVAGMLEHFYQLFYSNKEPPFTRYTLGLLAKDQTLNITAAKNILGYKPQVSIEEGLDRYVASLTKVSRHHGD
ncbi:MAG: NAD-dependent epimerase/dehydratase family protein [Gammaproteobacteria bacterium]|nr:NAD-dependent epimerase/dehydratase family protein [Gammaproteobacteria bacterium]